MPRVAPLAFLLSTLLAAPAPFAQEATPEATEADPSAAFMAGLKPQTGTIDLPGGKARMNLPDDLYYLSADDARKVIVEGWGNPPQMASGVLGMVVPTALNPLSQEGWGVVITYSDEGHVSDEDATKLDYAALMKDMQEGEAEENEARRKAGYEAVRTVGWAEPPHYDNGSHKIYWAKDLAFGDGSDVSHTLNYAIRVLGREGVLELNAVAGLELLPKMRTEMQEVVGVTEFTDGNRYADYKPGSDKLAAYGIAGLIAGSVAAKKGLFALIGIFLLKFWKLLAVGAVALVAGLGKLFGRKREA
jgi:uncharacterized membrane-anchored protein